MSTTTAPRQLELDFGGPNVDRSILRLSGGCFLVAPEGGPLELARRTELHVQVIDVSTGEIVGNAFGRIVGKGVKDRETNMTDDDGELIIESTLEHTAKLS